jgi:CO dehydrogenase maturation factor
VKIAVSGKGGAGKTTISALLCLYFESRGREILALDADPDTNLALALGFEDAESLAPVTAMKSLIEERVGSDRDSVGSYFRLNPRVDDIPERFSKRKGKIRLLAMGMRGPGKGCACPDNVFVKELVSHVLTTEKQVIILDMEAGIEHLGRGTVKAVDCFIIVVEPSKLNLDSARRISKWAGEIGIGNIAFISNRIRDLPWENKLLQENLPRNIPIISHFPYSEELMVRDEEGIRLPAPGSAVMGALEKVGKYLAKIE